jgi:hypothetical protein
MLYVGENYTIFYCYRITFKETIMEMKKIYYCLGGVALSIALVACGNDAQKSSETTSGEGAQQVAEAPTAATAPASQAVTSGKVLETMDASGYTYVRFDDGSGKEIWAAGPKANIEIGEEIGLQGGSVMSNFSSKSLERTFEEIIFASGFIRGGADGEPSSAGSFASAVEGEVGAGASDSGGSAGAVVEFAELKVDKAEGENAKTVSEIFAQSADIDTQKVVVKGQVVKISRNIMGKNWLHLQDGTGDPLGNTHDLVVTTDGEAEKGAIVTVEGIIAANKDFGSGYKYDVIIEEAVISQ